MSHQKNANKVDLFNLLGDLEDRLKGKFGEDVWIPRSGISKNGNLYITLLFKDPLRTLANETIDIFVESLASSPIPPIDGDMTKKKKKK